MQYNPMKSFWKWERALNSRPNLSNTAWFVLDQEEKNEEKKERKRRNYEMKSKKRGGSKSFQRWGNPLQQSLTIGSGQKIAAQILTSQTAQTGLSFEVLFFPHSLVIPLSQKLLFNSSTLSKKKETSKILKRDQKLIQFYSLFGSFDLGYTRVITLFNFCTNQPNM